MLRMNNLQDDGWDLSDLKYVDLGDAARQVYLLVPGDILINRTNGSRELVGKSEVFREAGEWVFASYLMRLRVDTTTVLPEFVSTFLNTGAGRMQVERASRQILMSNINAAEVRALLIPLPPLDLQQGLIEELIAARSARDAQLARSDSLLAGLDGYLLARLELEPAPDAEALTFAVRLSELQAKRLDPPAHRHILARSRPPTVPLRRLADLAGINVKRFTAPVSEEALVPYVGLPECTLTQVREIAERPFAEVRGRNVAGPGDILFARIEPSVFNKKYVLVDQLPHEVTEFFTSSEFYVVTPTEVVTDYLYAMFFCSFVHAQVRGRTTGSSGRRRIDRALFDELRIPVPDPETQEDIAREVRELRARSRELRGMARQGWDEAKTEFETVLLGEDVST
jgi:type I restriction enzyme S subunit